jgi:hypothetical protein
VQRKRDDASHADFFGRLLDTFAVDPDVARLDHALGERAALHEADKEEEAIDSHLVTSRGAKQSGTALLDCFIASLLAIAITSS